MDSRAFKQIFFGENLSKVWTSVIFILCQIVAIE